MRLAKVSRGGQIGVAIKTEGGIKAVFGNAAPDLDALIASGQSLGKAAEMAAAGESVEEASLTFLPPLVRAPKIICLGLNYRDHAEESGMAIPDFPTVFARFNSSLLGHGQPMIKPSFSDQLDYEAELAVVVGKGGKDISEDAALDHVAAYSVFNDGSVRDYQLRTPQWTVGKNFDSTGGFGPWLVTPDELPEGASGLKIQTRLNGQVVQSSNTEQMIFDVRRAISLLSRCFTLEPGDLFVMGTPAGVGLARDPKLFMKDGDVIEVEIEKIGLLVNPIKAA